MRPMVFLEAPSDLARDRVNETGDDVRDFANAALRGVRRVGALALTRQWTKLDAYRLRAEIDGVVGAHAGRYGVGWPAAQAVAAFALATVELDGVPLDVAASWDGNDWPAFAARHARRS